MDGPRLADLKLGQRSDTTAWAAMGGCNNSVYQYRSWKLMMVRREENYARPRSLIGGGKVRPTGVSRYQRTNSTTIGNPTRIGASG